jgi:hypothetical protein
MPQLDLFTLLFQFKIFFVCFSLLYLLFVLLIIPQIHKTIRLRRMQMLYYYISFFFVKKIIFFYYNTQCFFMIKNYVLFNKIFKFYYLNFLLNKINLTTFLIK